jgi:iron complex outermembrane receptor protein
MAIGTRAALTAFGVLCTSEALAQSSTNVATVVVDAFGEKVGSEQIGLYNEQQVRGFSLQESGNYRIDGAYFIRSANIVDPALDGVTIRVGVNALGVDFPAPSGIVEYRMPTAAPGAREQVEFAYRDYGGWAVLSRGSAASSDGKIGASYGLNIINDTGSDGVPRRPRHFALVPVWRPNDAIQIKTLFSVDRFTKQGDYQTTVSGSVLPPKQPNPGAYAADWTRLDQWQYAGGVVMGYAPSDIFALQSSFVVTDLDRDRGDFTLLTLGADGTGSATAVRSRLNQARSAAAETRASLKTADNQRLFATLRWRTSKSQVRPGVSVPFTFVDQSIGIPVTPAPPDPPDVVPTVDFTRQFMGGIGYEADITDTLWLRGAVLKTHYKKQVTPPGAMARTSTATPWLYDLAATYNPTDSLTVFATTVRGLEESGTAPNNAANRNEVLPAVMATQYELGMRYRIGAGVTFIGSLFEISKPTPGIDTLNVYGLIGQARHRGIELSLTGKPAEGFNVVGGLALLEPARLGELVDRGLILGRAAGVPTVTGLVNLTYQLPFLDGLSIDSQLNYTSKRLLNPRTGVYTPGYATLDIGARYAFKIGSNTATLRGRIGNAFDVDEWMAMRSETMNRVQRRAFRLSLTTNFDHPGLFD